MSDAKVIHRVALDLLFPEGVSPGGGKDETNRLVVRRNGLSLPVLPGSALAGLLRHAWARLKGVSSRDSLDVAAWFGAALGDDDWDRKKEAPSRLTVSDLTFAHGDVVERTHHARDRHTGAVRARSLFTVEALRPGSRGSAVVWLEEGESEQAAEGFIGELLGLIARGMLVGGRSARGFGRTEMTRALVRRFDLTDIGQHAEYLDELHAFGGGEFPSTGDSYSPSPEPNDRRLSLVVKLAIPAGQDLLVGEGQGCDFTIEPQRVSSVDGEGKRVERWRLPGATLRGALRSWVTRLAAREGQPVADSVERYRARGSASGNQVMWAFMSDAEQEAVKEGLSRDPTRLNEMVGCPVARLFGSGFSKGRIHVSDALSERSITSEDEQVRKHVAVDRITGGANDGMLFDNVVLVGKPAGHVFVCHIEVEEASKDEARWLAATLRAIDLGLLRIGSSKSAGRLTIATPIQATGAQSAHFAGVGANGN